MDNTKSPSHLGSNADGEKITVSCVEEVTEKLRISARESIRLDESRSQVSLRRKVEPINFAVVRAETPSVFDH